MTTNYLWLTAILAVETLMCAADLLQQKQTFLGRLGASDVLRSDVGKRRLRDLVLIGVKMNSVLSYDTNDNQRSVAESLESLLRAGYRYFELDVREDDRLFYWSTGSCNTMNVREQISPALVSLASFSRLFPSDLFVLRFALEAQPEHRTSRGPRLLATISAHLGSRSVSASRVFESAVDEVLSTQRNVVVLVKNLSLLLPSSPADVNLLRLSDIFVDDNTARNDTRVNERNVVDRGGVVLEQHRSVDTLSVQRNVVDRGGVVLEQHRSVDTLSVLTLSWQAPDPATKSRLLCHSSLLPLFVVCVVVCWAVSRLSTGRLSVYKVYVGVAAASATMTFILAQLMITSNSLPIVGDTNNSCMAVVDASRRWIARPARYRLNVLIVDHRTYCCDCTCSSVVGLAALANAGRIRRQVTLIHAGSPLSDEAVGLRAIFTCPSVLFAYVVTSRDEGHVVAWNQLTEGDSVNFEEGEFPMDATVAIYVATVWNRWLHVSVRVIFNCSTAVIMHILLQLTRLVYV